MDIKILALFGCAGFGVYIIVFYVPEVMRRAVSLGIKGLTEKAEVLLKINQYLLNNETDKCKGYVTSEIAAALEECSQLKVFAERPFSYLSRHKHKAMITDIENTVSALKRYLEKFSR